MTHHYMNIKYDKLHNQDDQSDFSDDVPLLSIEEKNNNKIITDNNNDSDSDSILLDLNMNQHNIQHNVNQKKIDNTSRNIIRFYLSTLIIISFTFAFLILGYKDYYDTSSDNIIFGSYGQLLLYYKYMFVFTFYCIFNLSIFIYCLLFKNVSTYKRYIIF